MKITKRQLQRIIKEELSAVLEYEDRWPDGQGSPLHNKAVGAQAQRSEKARISAMSKEERAAYWDKYHAKAAERSIELEKSRRAEKAAKALKRDKELQSQGITDDFMDKFEEGIANGRFTRKELQEYIHQKVMKVLESRKPRKNNT